MQITKDWISLHILMTYFVVRIISVINYQLLRPIIFVFSKWLIAHIALNFCHISGKARLKMGPSLVKLPGLALFLILILAELYILSFFKPTTLFLKPCLLEQVYQEWLDIYNILTYGHREHTYDWITRYLFFFYFIFYLFIYLFFFCHVMAKL